jgi:uncharacterized protein
MKTGWINPKVIIGPAATGEYYYHRQYIVADIWEEVAKPSNILIAAPRRVGKSSVMEYMAANPIKDFKCVFKNIQGVKSENDFYKTFYQLIVLALNNAQQKITWLKQLWNELKIEEVSLDGIKLGKKDVDFFTEINLLIHNLKDKKTRIVLFIDELPEVLHRLHKDGRTQEAVSILKNLRSWLLSPEFKQSISLVLAGSVGIHHVVQLIEGRTADINHLGKIDFEALDRPAAADYIKWATAEATIQYSPALAKQLLDKIQYYVPYFINLMLEEINRTARKKAVPKITKIDIDAAFEKVIAGNDHFADWKSRLFEYMPENDALFLNAVLAHAAKYNTISIRKVYDMRRNYGSEHNCMDLLNNLLKDGYLLQTGDSFSFISPFLQTFWQRNNPNYNG